MQWIIQNVITEAKYLLDNTDLSIKEIATILNVYSDQIVWGRSPVRIDVAGGWTDTPPYSLYSGGSVVNLAIDVYKRQGLYRMSLQKLNICSIIPI